MMYTIEQKIYLYNKFLKSGHTAAKFCRENGLHAPSFYCWKEQIHTHYRREKEKEKEDEQELLEESIDVKKTLADLREEIENLNSRLTDNYDFLSQKNGILQKRLEIIYAEQKIKINSLYKFGALGFTLVAVFDTIIFFLSR